MKTQLLNILQEHTALGIANQLDYSRFYLYSIITYSTAIEGSTVTEIENQLLFDEGIAAQKPMIEQLMNLDLKAAYEYAIKLAETCQAIDIQMLCDLSAKVMKNTGSVYNTPQGSFDSSKGELRKVKIKPYLEKFCSDINTRFARLIVDSDDIIEKYLLSFDAHYQLVTIHPWVDGSGRMARLIMNYLQFEFGLPPVKVLKEDKALYIKALVDSREQGSLELFREFMLGEHIRNLQNEISAYKKSISAI